MTNSSNTTVSRWEWSGSFQQGQTELINGADNSSFDYSGNQAFETMEFSSTLTAAYILGTGTQTFTPDYETYELIVDSNLPPNLILTSQIVNDALQIDISGNLGLLKDYAPPFLLPSNFTFDEYDSPDGFYAQGYNLIKAGGNYKFIVDQPTEYVINLNLTVNLYPETQDPPPSEDPAPEDLVKSTTKEFTITVGRNYSVMRNQFISAYLEEQKQRGDVDYYTYKGVKYYNSTEYLNVLIQDLGWSYYF